MDSVRAFIAIELGEEVKRSLEEAGTELKRALDKVGLGRRFKWTSQKNAHLTLKFLGDLDAARFEEIAEGVAGGIEGVGPFLIRPAGLGAFPVQRACQ